jgi:hypothetical protein
VPGTHGGTIEGADSKPTEQCECAVDLDANDTASIAWITVSRSSSRAEKSGSEGSLS